MANLNIKRIERKSFGNERFPLVFLAQIGYTLDVHKNKEVNVREHTKV